MQEHKTLERAFGARAGGFFQELLESRGVTVHGDDELERFAGEGRVSKVITRRGLELPADAVVVGAGVLPDVQLARSAGLAIGKGGGVRCSARLESSAAGVFAAGDICEYDSPVHRGTPTRIEHWDVAFNHGKTAALNMLGNDVPHEEVPYFFSDLADWGGFEYVGPANRWDEEIVRGSIDEGSFTNWYLQDGAVKAALTVGRSDDLEHARRLIVDGSPLDDRTRARLADPSANLGGVLR
jgi:3-phenylpropionate/trans-cinnamate dioxygenase ferredoxin reductase subunit